ncbi:MAG: hypothetical protein PHR75_01935 [Sulfurovum sp.]|nr:hypothetical protein [Sulfurovum sp.]MDD3602820.1 hypothetical protein [Sulfurovum sp.]
MLKTIWVWLFVCLAAAYSVEICVEIDTPAQQIKINGNAKDMVVYGNKLYIVTEQGFMQEYDYTAQTFTYTIELPQIKDFAGDMVPARIFSVDYNEGKYLLLSDSGKGGYTNMWIHENNTTKQIFGPENKKALVKARFIDQKHILLAYLSNEAALYDIDAQKELYRVKLSESKFSDFALNADKSLVIFSCESGILSLVDVPSGKVMKELKGMNLDNVYKVDFKQNIVSGAGQDRRGSLYDVTTGRGDYIEGNFLIYATGLSPNAKKVAFAMDERNDISVYDVVTKAKIAVLHGQKSTLNAIIFKDEMTLFSTSDDNTVMMWELK